MIRQAKKTWRSIIARKKLNAAVSAARNFPALALGPLRSLRLTRRTSSTHPPSRPVEDPSNPAFPPWSTSPTAKEKNAVQRAATALLDELAPERAPQRGDRIRVPVERHRTPTGCVLQAASAALSVSWFADAAVGAALGELRVILWRGIVSRRGAPRRSEGATVVRELVLHPIERPSSGCIWRATDGAEYDTASLAAHCVALLEEQMRGDGPADGSG